MGVVILVQCIRHQVNPLYALPYTALYVNYSDKTRKHMHLSI